MTILSKSKIQKYKTCSKKLWLSEHKRQLEIVSALQQSIMDQGTEFGVIARTFYPGGELIETHNTMEAVKQTQAIFRRFNNGEAKFPIYEAGFVHNDVVVRVDILVPELHGSWKIVEIKSGSAKDEDGFKANLLFDVAIQKYVVSNNDIKVSAVELGCPNKSFIYAEAGDLNGVLESFEVTQQAALLANSVTSAIEDAKAIIMSTSEPVEAISSPKCSGCGFIQYCTKTKLEEGEQILVPSWNLSSSPVTQLVQTAMLHSRDLQFVPDEVLKKAIQLQMKRVARSEIPNYIDTRLVEHLSEQAWPRYFLDYEFFAPAVPVFLDTRPAERIPFQFSLHKWSGPDIPITHKEFIADTKHDPRRQFIEALVAAFDEHGPIFTWNGIKTESPVTTELIPFADERSAEQLRWIAERCTEDDLYPWFTNYFYTPGMVGWGLKQVSGNYLESDPYQSLEVKNGMGAVEAYLDFLQMEDSPEKDNLKSWLLEYCKTDTLVMFNIWEKIVNRIRP